MRAKSGGERMSAEETRAALITALIALLDAKSAAAISVREVAARAGVNHGLVHRYFGSKAGLVAAAVQAMSAELHAGDPALAGMSAATFATLRKNPAIARLVARTCLDGPRDLLALASPPRERLEEIVAPIRAALARSPLAAHIDPYVINALASAAFLGWFAFKPLLEKGFGLPKRADNQVAALLSLVDRLVVAPPSAPVRK
jgi:AcrR family transcriptional regulator